MTTIAYRAGTLAADRAISYSGSREAEHTKIVRRDDGALMGCAGTTSLCEAVKRWFLGGEVGERPPLKLDTEEVNALIVRPDGTLEVHDWAGWYVVEAPYFTLGSGSGYALGALAHGANAEEAVRIAMMLDNHTGGGMDVLRLPSADAIAREVLLTACFTSCGGADCAAQGCRRLRKLKPGELMVIP